MSMIRPERLLAAALLSFMLGSASAKQPDTAAIDGDGETADAAGPMLRHAQLMRFLFQPVEDPNQLRGYRGAILAADGVDGFDLEVPRAFLAERGATVHIIVARPRHVLQAAGSGAVIKPKTEIAVLEPSGEQETASFDRFLDQVRAEDYHVIYLPGHPGMGSGLNDPNSITFLQEAARADKPIFAAGNSPDALVTAGLLNYRPTRDPVALSSPAWSTPNVPDALLAHNAMIYTSRDAFDMPVLIDRLITALLTRPVALPQ
jgi:protease I